MTDEINWAECLGRAQGLITGYARNAPNGAFDDWFRRKAEDIVKTVGCGREFLPEIAQSIKDRAKAGV